MSNLVKRLLDMHEAQYGSPDIDSELIQAADEIERMTELADQSINAERVTGDALVAANQKIREQKDELVEMHRGRRSLETEVQQLRTEVSDLTAFRDAVVGWRENDWISSFCRATAERLAEHGKQAAQQSELRRIGSPAVSGSPKPTTCNWIEVDEYDCSTWETECGQRWEFMADGPVENQVSYCHGCGKSIQLSAADGRESS